MDTLTERPVDTPHPRLLRLVMHHRRAIVVAIYLVLIVASSYLAFWLRFDGPIPRDARPRAGTYHRVRARRCLSRRFATTLNRDSDPLVEFLKRPIPGFSSVLLQANSFEPPCSTHRLAAAGSANAVVTPEGRVGLHRYLRGRKRSIIAGIIVSAIPLKPRSALRLGIHQTPAGHLPAKLHLDGATHRAQRPGAGVGNRLRIL
jgi:hypothetical protein